MRPRPGRSRRRGWAYVRHVPVHRVHAEEARNRLAARADARRARPVGGQAAPRLRQLFAQRRRAALRAQVRGVVARGRRVGGRRRAVDVHEVRPRREQVRVVGVGGARREVAVDLGLGGGGGGLGLGLGFGFSFGSGLGLGCGFGHRVAAGLRAGAVGGEDERRAARERVQEVIEPRRAALHQEQRGVPALVLQVRRGRLAAPEAARADGRAQIRLEVQLLDPRRAEGEVARRSGRAPGEARARSGRGQGEVAPARQALVRVLKPQRPVQHVVRVSGARRRVEVRHVCGREASGSPLDADPLRQTP